MHPHSGTSFHTVRKHHSTHKQNWVQKGKRETEKTAFLHFLVKGSTGAKYLLLAEEWAQETSIVEHSSLSLPPHVLITSGSLYLQKPMFRHYMYAPFFSRFVFSVTIILLSLVDEMSYSFIKTPPGIKVRYDNQFQRERHDMWISKC